MFAGKSSYLIEKIRQHKMRGDRIKVLVPKIDIRSNNNILSHNNQYYPAEEFNYDIQEVDAIFIDEAQFIVGLKDYIKKYLKSDIKIYIAGLISDKFQETFGEIKDILCYASDIIFLKSICECGNLASFTIGGNTSNQIEIGNHYKPICNKCLLNAMVIQ